MAAELASLPDQLVVVVVAGNTTLRDRSRLACTCRRLHALVTGTPTLWECLALERLEPREPFDKNTQTWRPAAENLARTVLSLMRRSAVLGGPLVLRMPDWADMSEHLPAWRSAGLLERLRAVRHKGKLWPSAAELERTPLRQLQISCGIGGGGQGYGEGSRVDAAVCRSVGRCEALETLELTADILFADINTRTSVDLSEALAPLRNLKSLAIDGFHKEDRESWFPLLRTLRDMPSAPTLRVLFVNEWCRVEDDDVLGALKVMVNLEALFLYGASAEMLHRLDAEYLPRLRVLAVEQSIDLDADWSPPPIFSRLRTLYFSSCWFEDDNAPAWDALTRLATNCQQLEVIHLAVLEDDGTNGGPAKSSLPWDRVQMSLLEHAMPRTTIRWLEKINGTDFADWFEIHADLSEGGVQVGSHQPNLHRFWSDSESEDEGEDVGSDDTGVKTEAPIDRLMRMPLPTA